jgi:hypothetical protein
MNRRPDWGPGMESHGEPCFGYSLINVRRVIGASLRACNQCNSSVPRRSVVACCGVGNSMPFSHCCHRGAVSA